MNNFTSNVFIVNDVYTYHRTVQCKNLVYFGIITFYVHVFASVRLVNVAKSNNNANNFLYLA